MKYSFDSSLNQLKIILSSQTIQKWAVCHCLSTPMPSKRGQTQKTLHCMISIYMVFWRRQNYIAENRPVIAQDGVRGEEMFHIFTNTWYYQGLICFCF